MSVQQGTDEYELVRRIADQDQTALSRLYDRYARPMYAIALRVLGSAEEAEEVVLDVFCQVWRTADRFDPRRGRVDAWLFVQVRSRSLDRVRALTRAGRSVTASEEQAVLDLVTRVSDPEEDAVIGERRGKVLAALGELPDGQREVLELAYYKGLSHSEIAERTGEPLGTVKTRIRLGLRKLRDTLAPFWGGQS